MWINFDIIFLMSYIYIIKAEEEHQGFSSQEPFTIMENSSRKGTLYDVIHGESYNTCKKNETVQSEDVLSTAMQDPCTYLFILNHLNLQAILITENKLNPDYEKLISDCTQMRVNIALIEHKNNSIQLDNTFFDTSIFIYISLCSSWCTSELLDTASKFNIDKEQYLWIIFQPELIYSRQILPRNLILIRGRNCFESATNEVSFQSGVAVSTSSFDIVMFGSKNTDGKWNTVLATIDNKKVTLLPTFKTALSRFPVGHDSKVIYKVVTIIESPFTIIHESIKYEYLDQSCFKGTVCWVKGSNVTYLPHCCIGYCIDFLKKLENDLNMKTKLYIVEDSSYGAKVNGSWTGMVGDVVSQKADLVLAALTINAKRAHVVDFTEPYLVGGVAIATIIKNENLSFINSKVFEILTLELWISVFAVLFLTTIIMGKAKTTLDKNPDSIDVYFDSLYYLFGLMFQREIGAQCISFRMSFGIIAISFSVFMLVIMTTYTAALTAKKVTSKNNLPITGFKDTKVIHPTSSFTYGTIENSAFTQLFHDSNDPDWNRMYYFMKRYNFLNTSDAFDRLKNGELNGIIHDYPVILYHISKDKDCSIHFAGEPIKDAGYGIAVQKHSPLKEKLSDLIREYNRDGTLASLRTKWLSSSCVNSEIQSEYNAIGINYFGSLFIAMTSFTVLSFLIFLIEIYVPKQKNNAEIELDPDTTIESC